MAPLDRRRFLGRLGRFSAATWILGAHGPAAWGRSPSGDSRRESLADTDAVLGPRILSLELLTSAPLDEMAAFYGGRLELPVELAAGRLLVTAGASEITFRSGASGSAPYYHFAFNIPENKILAARDWQLERSELFLTPENLRDPNFPNDVRHFRNWDAHSVFFWDPAGNVVEYIARHTLANASSGAFTSEDILYASEIAFASDDVPAAGAYLEAELALPRYQSASEAFHATGDEHGLLLVFRRGRQLGDSLRGRGAPAEVFSTRATIRGREASTHSVPTGPFEVRVVTT